MTDFFPSDVRRVTDGDRDEAELLKGSAKSLLFRALLLQGASGNPDLPVRLVSRVDPDKEISVTLVGANKLVTISVAGKPAEEIHLPDDVRRADVFEAERLFPYTGIAKTGTIVTTGGKRYLHEFSTSPTTAGAHHLPTGFHDEKRLAVDPPQYTTIKGSMYSGTMKRVVQAVQGLGVIHDRSGFYLKGHPAVPASYQVPVAYNWTWECTHGVVKCGTHKHWLVEISKARGILAMPLPIIPSTRGASYAAWLRKIGDVGGSDIADEFGGLPSGEGLPDNDTELNDAIASGKVLRLKTAGAMTAFYTTGVRGRVGYYPDCGWALSGSGRLARNTCMTTVIEPPTGIYGSRERFIGEHWEIQFDLSEYNLHANPVGSGTCSVEKLAGDSGTIGSWYGGFNLWVPGEDVEELSQVQTFTVDTSDPGWPSLYIFPGASAASEIFIGGPMIQGEANGPSDYIPFDGGAVVHTFFDGEKPVVLCWCPGWRIDELSSSPAGFTIAGLDTRSPCYKSPGAVSEADGTFGGNGGWALIPRGAREGVLIAHTNVVATWAMVQLDEDVVPSPHVIRFSSSSSTAAVFSGMAPRNVFISSYRLTEGSDMAMGISSGSFPVFYPPVSMDRSRFAALWSYIGGDHCFMAANLNSGHTEAYVMTEKQLQDKPIDVDRGFIRKNLLPDTDSVRPEDITFVGGYR